VDVFRRIVFVAVIAGAITGFFVTIAHQFGTVPIILKAEVYEKATDQAEQKSRAAASSSINVTPHAMPSMEHSAGPEWEPADGFERTAYTVLADMVTAVAFALLLTSAYTLRSGASDWRDGLFWGLAGFATFTLAPGLGLPPEVPGTEAAPLLDRQIWWAATALATGGGLGLIFLQRRPVWAMAGVALLILPHLYGAPQPAEYRNAAPEMLAHQFVVASVATSLLFWVLLGSLTGHFYRTIGAPAKRASLVGAHRLRAE
jgi:cobalt transporter subunit CbtA